jgi:hypothetical protein
MSSLSALTVVVRPNVARVAVVGTFAVLLVGLGFLVPFWIVLGVSSAVILITGLIRKVKLAARAVDTILAEELGPNAADQ